MEEDKKTPAEPSVPEEAKTNGSGSKGARIAGGVVGVVLCVAALFGALYASYLFMASMPHESLEASHVDEGFSYDVNVEDDREESEADVDGDAKANFGKEDETPSFSSFLWSTVTGSGGSISDESDAYSIKAESFCELEQMMEWYNESLARAYVFAGVRSGIVLLISIGVLGVGANCISFAIRGERKPSKGSKEAKEDEGSASKADDIQPEDNEAGGRCDDGTVTFTDSRGEAVDSDLAKPLPAQ